MKMLATAIGEHGIHVSAELRISAIQLRDHRIGWAADVMERAAKHIDALEAAAALAGKSGE